MEYVEGHPPPLRYHPSCMINRDYKNFYPGGFFHIYNRGHNKNSIFKDEEDYYFILARTRQILGLQKSPSKWINPLPSNSFAILSYCLMPNHFHFLIHQKTNVSISKLMGKLCTSYSIFFNKKYNQIGSLFQDQFKAKLVDYDSYLLHLSAYIHKNPKAPYKWSHSSFYDYLGNRNDHLVDKNLILKMVGGQSKYKDFVDDYNSEEELLIGHLTFEED